MADPSCPVTDHKAVSAIHNETASRLDIGSLQKVPPSHWKPCLENLHVCMADATCHESHMRFPTNMKLIRESVGWLYRHTCRHYRNLGIRCPRNKYTDVSESCLSCCKKRKRKASRTRMPKHRMPRILEILVMQRNGIHGEYGAPPRYARDYQKRLSVIRKVLVREKELFAGRKVSGRIVGIDRHYVRPVVRGEETKPVESGARIDNMQTDGISFIGHVPSKASNRGIRLKERVRMQQKLMDVRVKRVAADSIYADNADRKSCTKYGISASFVRKGRVAKDGQSGRFPEVNSQKRRAARLGGGFGTQKATLPALKNKGAEQEDGNPVDFRLDTCGKCRTDGRQNQKRSSDFFQNLMVCRISSSDKTQKITIKMAHEVITGYHLHMPS